MSCVVGWVGWTVVGLGQGGRSPLLWLLSLCLLVVCVGVGVGVGVDDDECWCYVGAGAVVIVFLTLLCFFNTMNSWSSSDAWRQDISSKLG